MKRRVKRRKGTVEKLPSGRFRARIGRETLGTFDTEAQANAALGGGNLAAIWEAFAVHRRKIGVRDWKNDEGRWDLYVGPDPISLVPFHELTRREAKHWLGRMHGRALAPQTIKNTLNLIRQATQEAVELELLAANPFDKLRVHKSAEGTSTDKWTILDPDEQLRLIKVVDPDELDTVVFALFCGLRNTEQWRLPTSDIDIIGRSVAVRFSRQGKPVKTGKLRRVPLFGPALEAANRVVERGTKYAFPSPRTGQRRYDSKFPTRWPKWLKAAGINRRVRWYDLRHTCATSLLAGWWGRKWSIDEVRQMLGHSSIKQTEKYAHAIDDTLARAGAATPGFQPTTWDETGASFEIRTRDLRFTKSLLLESFPLVAQRTVHERYDGPHDRFAAFLIQAAQDSLRRQPLSEARLAKGVELWEAARHAG